IPLSKAGWSRVTHPSATRLTPEGVSSFDLHVLGTPPAFVLSQDQTLHRKLNSSFGTRSRSRSSCSAADQTFGISTLETHARRSAQPKDVVPSSWARPLSRPRFSISFGPPSRGQPTLYARALSMFPEASPGRAAGRRGGPDSPPVPSNETAAAASRERLAART